MPISLRVGNFEITPIFDGRLASGLDKIPDAEDRAAAAKLVTGDPAAPIVFNVFAFLVRGPDGLSLIDAGSGDKKGRPFGKLVENLAAMNISVDEISRIYMTHWHGDHFGGLTDELGRRVFNKAEIIMSEPEAKFWFDTAVNAMPMRAQRALPIARAVFEPYRDRIRTVMKNGAYGGLTAVPAPGHTPGHTCWLIESRDVSALAWGDVVHIASIHFCRPLTGFEYDLDPAMAGESRLNILNRVVGENLLAAGAHLDGSGLGRLTRDGDAFRFESIVS